MNNQLGAAVSGAPAPLSQSDIFTAPASTLSTACLEFRTRLLCSRSSSDGYVPVPLGSTQIAVSGTDLPASVFT
jgi:hypothetical protein